MACALFIALEEDLEKSSIQMEEATGIEPPRENESDKNKTIETYGDYLQATQLRKDAIEGYDKSIQHWVEVYTNAFIKNPKLEQTLTDHQIRMVKSAARVQSKATGALTVLASNIRQTRTNLDEYAKQEVSSSTPERL